MDRNNFEQQKIDESVKAFKLEKLIENFGHQEENEVKDWIQKYGAEVMRKNKAKEIPIEFLRKNIFELIVRNLPAKSAPEAARLEN